MLFTMVSTVDHGNFILYKCPHFRTYPDIDIEDPPADILVKITNHFSYCTNIIIQSDCIPNTKLFIHSSLSFQNLVFYKLS